MFIALRLLSDRIHQTKARSPLAMERPYPLIPFNSVRCETPFISGHLWVFVSVQLALSHPRRVRRTAIGVHFRYDYAVLMRIHLTLRGIGSSNEISNRIANQSDDGVVMTA